MKARFNTLNQWLEWQETHHPSAIDLGLQRVNEVAIRLGVLSPSARVITIAGTNGKGSCVATLEALLNAAGKRFGAYTSPHLLHYNERVRLQAQPVSDHQLCQAFNRIDQARGEISLTYFEFGTLAAMDIFNREPLDYWVLEVGLGGRLDAVNIIDADVAVITSVAIDHEAWLGSSREQIGYEKAGICRPSKPLICADHNPPSTVVDHAKRLNCQNYWWGNNFGCDNDQHFFTQGGLKVSTANVNLPKPSVAAALQVCELEGCLPAIVNVQATLAATALNGRMQGVKAGPLNLILDVAHNPAAAELLASEVSKRNLAPVVAVVAMMADKDAVGILAPMASLVNQWFCVGLEGNSRAAQPNAIANTLINDIGVPKSQVHCGQNVAKVLASLSLEYSGNNGVQRPNILIFGSFFTVADALSYSNAYQ